MIVIYKRQSFCDCRQPNLRIKHAVTVYVYTAWTVMMAGAWLLAGRFPCVFLTLGSFPRWHTPEAHRSPLWDDSCLTQTCPGHALVKKNKNILAFFLRWYNMLFLYAFLLVCKVLWSNLNAVIGEQNWRAFRGWYSFEFMQKQCPFVD